MVAFIDENNIEEKEKYKRVRENCKVISIYNKGKITDNGTNDMESTVSDLLEPSSKEFTNVKVIEERNLEEKLENNDNRDEDSIIVIQISATNT